MCLFFKAISGEFEKSGHEVVWTARDYAQTVELAVKAGIKAEIIGSHGGRSVLRKGLKFVSRIRNLVRWAGTREIELAVSHNSHEILVASRLLRIKSVNLMDYEHHPANHLSFRMANRVLVPESFPDEFVRKFGATAKTLKYKGIKEDVYLAKFEPDDAFEDELNSLGIRKEHILVVVRPHADEALYHRGFENTLLEKVLEKFSKKEDVRVIFLPRKKESMRELLKRFENSNVIVPEKVLDGANLISYSDLVISGGGTMNREAAALSTPTATIFSGKPAAIDEYLVREGRLLKLRSADDLENLGLIRKKAAAASRNHSDLKQNISALILREF